MASNPTDLPGPLQAVSPFTTDMDIWPAPQSSGRYALYTGRDILVTRLVGRYASTRTAFTEMRTRGPVASFRLMCNVQCAMENHLTITCQLEAFSDESQSPGNKPTRASGGRPPRSIWRSVRRRSIPRASQPRSLWSIINLDRAVGNPRTQLEISYWAIAPI
jgi:hypothetical protein